MPWPATNCQLGGPCPLGRNPGDRRGSPARLIAQDAAPADIDELRKGPTVKLDDDLLALLRKPSICFLATSMADGSPQVTQTWVDTDGEHVIINSVQTHVKVRNIERDPRVAAAIADPDDPSHYYQVRGRVIEVSTDGGPEHIDMLSQKYHGTPYPWYGGRDQVRVVLTIEADSVSGTG